MPLIIIGAVFLIGLIIVVTIKTRQFNEMVDTEIRDLLHNTAQAHPETISDTDFEGIPQPLQGYLKRVLKAGQPYADCVRLKQAGQMRLSPEQAWRPFTAEQYFSTKQAGFVWRTTVRFAPLLQVTGRDKYFQQKGHMLIQLLSTLPVVNATGEKLSSASLIRYLSEMPWFPSSFLNNELVTYEAVDTNRVKVSAKDGQTEGAVTFHFDEQGELVKLTADRYRDMNDDTTTVWFGNYIRSAEMDGVRIPVEFEVGWELESGPFIWLKAHLTELEYNVPEQYTY